MVGKVQGMVGEQGGASKAEQVVKGTGDPKVTSSDTAHTLILRRMGS